MWHTVVIRDTYKSSFNFQLEFAVKTPHIKRMGRIKKIGDKYGFVLQFIFVRKNKDRMIKKNKKLFVYPFTTREQAEVEYREIRDMRKRCLDIRKNIIQKKNQQEETNE